MQCGLSESETCLKSVTLALTAEKTVREPEITTWNNICMNRWIHRWARRFPLIPSSSSQVITIQPNGKVFVNGIYSQLPFSAGETDLRSVL